MPKHSDPQAAKIQRKRSRNIKRPLPKDPAAAFTKLARTARGNEIKQRRKDRTSKVDAALEGVLEGPGGSSAAALIKSLSISEQALFEQLVNAERGSISLEELWKVDYVTPPPSIETFIDDPYWLGGTLAKTDENEGLWPIWRDVAERDWDLDSRVHNAVFTGSLGIGKSFCLGAILLYRVALCTLLRNPQSFLGLAKGSKIYYVLLSLTRSVVEETVFSDMKNFMTNSPFFREECLFDPDRKYSDFRISLGKGVFMTAGSKSWHVIGRNTMGIALDEGNWRLEANPDMRAYALYDEVRNRLKNRFQKTAGFLPAVSLLSSSAKDESSFTERVIGDIDKSGDDNQKVYRFAAYKVKAFTVKYMPQWFKVSYGLKNIDPQVLSGWYSKEGVPLFEKDRKTPLLNAAHEEAAGGAKTELVPRDYHVDYIRNTKVSLQSHSGISTGGTNLFFSSTADLEFAIQRGEEDGLVNPAKAEMIPISMEDDREIWDYLDHRAFLTRINSIVRPKRHADAARFAHLDLATSSMAGIGICHPVGKRLVQGHTMDGQPFSEYRITVEADFILTIIAGQSKPISLEKIQRFFFWLRDRCGFSIRQITADMYASQMPLQMLQSRGFETKLLSLDRSKTPYYTVRTAFQEQRLIIYRQQQLMREAERLVDGDKKIDHPPESEGGSKDTIDGFAGAVYSALTCDDPVMNLQYDAAPGVLTTSQLDVHHEKPLVTTVVPKASAPVPISFSA